jgi:hypothetical protein
MAPAALKTFERAKLLGNLQVIQNDSFWKDLEERTGSHARLQQFNRPSYVRLSFRGPAYMRCSGHRFPPRLSRTYRTPLEKRLGPTL